MATKPLDYLRPETDKAANPGRVPDRDWIDEASEESFPASDPPSWTTLVARPPVVREMEPPAHPQVEDFETAFSEPELDSIHAQDVHGGGRIVGLLLGIFGFGLLMYSAIFFWVLSTIKD